MTQEPIKGISRNDYEKAIKTAIVYSNEKQKELIDRYDKETWEERFNKLLELLQ